MRAGSSPLSTAFPLSHSSTELQGLPPNLTLGGAVRGTANNAVVYGGKLCGGAKQERRWSE